MQAELDEIRRLADLPRLFNSETEERVFSHKSLFARPAHVHLEIDEPQDYERLAFLGVQVLAFIATEMIFERYPYARPSFLTEKRTLVTKNEEIAKWSLAYELPQRVIAYPLQQALVQSSIPVRASVFEAYVGAVFNECGIDSVGTWVKPLMRRVLSLDDIARRTPRSELSSLPSRVDSPLPRGVDSDAGTGDMNERVLFRLDAMSESDSTDDESRNGGYELVMSQFSNRCIAPSSPDSFTNTPLTTTSTFFDAAEAQPITVATGRPGPQRNEIRDYQPGRYLSPSQLLLFAHPQHTPDTMSSPPYSHQQCPPFPGGGGSSRSTVRPSVGSPLGPPSTNFNMPSSRPSPSVRSSSSGDSTGTQSSTRCVVGVGVLATQRKGKVELRMGEGGPHQRSSIERRQFGRKRQHGLLPSIQSYQEPLCRRCHKIRILKEESRVRLGTENHGDVNATPRIANFDDDFVIIQ